MLLAGITKVITDADLDGIFAAAILKRIKPELKIIFSRAAQMRSGIMDNQIDRFTAICDLPFDENCGLYIDHHDTNRPTESDEQAFIDSGGIFHWRPTPSAARAAYDLFKDHVDLSHVMEMMAIVDAHDSGEIDLDLFLADPFMLQLARTINISDPEFLQALSDAIATGADEVELQRRFGKKVAKVSQKREWDLEYIRECTTIVDRLAICRLEDTGVMSSGYLVTAVAGDAVDACCIIHGQEGGRISDPLNPPLAASFYTNSFLSTPNRFDLSRMATLLDDTGGGHKNACGCRIQPLTDDGELIFRDVNLEDIDRNLELWLALWHDRENTL
jgi:oligoribonuclease NrnB/cAMP/cGMP phosphodiesterase (DHH superfamily)